MNIEIIKTMRRALCKAVGHDYIDGACNRCKKRQYKIELGSPEYMGCFPPRYDVDIPLDSVPEAEIGDIKWDPELQTIILYDGKNWNVC